MILITGASGGIGYELSKLYAKDHNDLILVARNLDKLKTIKEDFEKAYGIKVHVYSFDLSKAEAPNELYNAINKDNLEVSELINNAGFGDYGEFINADIAKYQNLIDLNISSLVNMTYLFAKDMVQRKKGRIINVGSIASFMPGPFMSVYYASKAFVLSFSEAISVELKPHNVHVCVLCPGPTSTNFFNRAGANEKSDFASNGALFMTPEEVAKYGYKRFKKNKVISLPGFKNRSAVRAIKFFPRSLVRKIIASVQKHR